MPEVGHKCPLHDKNLDTRGEGEGEDPEQGVTSANLKFSIG